RQPAAKSAAKRGAQHKLFRCTLPASARTIQSSKSLSPPHSTCEPPGSDLPVRGQKDRRTINRGGRLACKAADPLTGPERAAGLPAQPPRARRAGLSAGTEARLVVPPPLLTRRGPPARGRAAGRVLFRRGH